MAGDFVVVPFSTGSHRRACAARRRAACGRPSSAAEQSLAADDERVYVAAGEAIHALNAADGRVAWRAPLGAAPTAPALAHGGWVVAAAGGELIAIRAADGTVMWRRRVGPVEFRPSLDGELLVASIVDGQLVALDSATDRRAGQPGSARRRANRWPSAAASTSARRIATSMSLHSSSGRVEDHRRIAAELLGRVAVTDAARVLCRAGQHGQRACRGAAARFAGTRACSIVPAPDRSSLGDVVIVPGMWSRRCRRSRPRPARPPARVVSADCSWRCRCSRSCRTAVTRPSGSPAGSRTSGWCRCGRRRSCHRSRCSRLRCCPAWRCRSCRPACDARGLFLANRRGEPRDPLADPLRRRRRERQPHQILAGAVHEERFARQRR